MARTEQVPLARRPGRTARQPRPGRPADPRRPASPVRSPGPGRPGRPVRTGPARPAGQSRQRQRPPLGQRADRRVAAKSPPAGSGGSFARASGAASTRRADRVEAHPGRMSFILLVIGLLAVSLVFLLVVNTTLATAAFQISGLTQANAASTQRLQQLRQATAAQQSAAVIQREAIALGMRPDAQLTFVDLRGPGLAGRPGRAILAGERGRPAAGKPGTATIVAASGRHRVRRRAA